MPRFFRASCNVAIRYTSARHRGVPSQAEWPERAVLKPARRRPGKQPSSLACHLVARSGRRLAYEDRNTGICGPTVIQPSTELVAGHLVIGACFGGLWAAAGSMAFSGTVRSMLLITAGIVTAGVLRRVTRNPAVSDSLTICSIASHT